MWKGLRETLYSLKECPRELWLIFVVKALESYSYFSMSLIYVIYLTDTFHVGDIAAGGSYGLWGMLTVLWGVVLGPAVDMLGIRKCLIICFAAEFVCRVLMATTTSLPMLYFLMYTLLPASGALGVPVMTIAVKRYTTPKARSMAYGLFYTVMNVAALVNGFALDALRKWLCHGINIPGITLNDGNRVVVASGAVSAAIALVVTLCLSPAVEEEALAHVVRSGSTGLYGDEAGETVGLVTAAPSSQHHLAVNGRSSENLVRAWPEGRTSGSWLMRTATKASNTFIAVHNSTVELLAYPGMWKYLVMALFLLNLRQTYRYMDSMLPKYMLRSIGCDAPYGTVYAINPAMIIALVPIVTATTAHIPHFDMVHYGSFVSASSPFWIYLVQSPSALGPILFVVQLSLGESVWSPRWYDYTMDVAPEGREGLFGAIAAAPLFLAKLPTGLLSGFLLDRYCPLVNGGCNPSSADVCPREDALYVDAVSPAGAQSRILLSQGTAGVDAGLSAARCDAWLWAIVGFVTMSTPLLITVFQRCLRPTADEAGGSRGVDEEAREAASREVQLIDPQSYEAPVRSLAVGGLDTVVEGSQELGSGSIFGALNSSDLLEQSSRDRQHASGSLPPM